jgi:uncharacterized membrane protein
VAPAGNGPRTDSLRSGWERNVRAITIASALLVGLWLLPDIPPPAGVQQPVDLARGRIEAFLPDTGDPTIPDVVIRVEAGPHSGELLEGYLQGPQGQQDVPQYAVGDEVVVSLAQGPDEEYIAVSDRYRVPLFAGLLGLFALGVIAVGGWRGLRSLLALALTLGVVAKLVVPLLLAGWEPVPVAVVAGTAVTLTTILLTEGVRPASLAAAGGTFASLALTAVLAAIVNGLAQFTQYQGSEAAVFLQSMGLSNIDLTGLFLAAVIFGALGVLDDVTVTQAAAVAELRATSPQAPRTAVFRRAMAIGRSHIAATVNTLVLAYVGASLPLLLLFAVGETSPLVAANQELLAVEVVRALAGSIGIVAAVPLTTAIAAFVVAPADARSDAADHAHPGPLEA